jgi:hypothetical protein
MAMFTALLIAATAGPPAYVPTRAVAAAQASVRILKPVRVSLSARRQPDGYRQHKTIVMLEDGSRRPALVVEFE